MVLIIQRIAAYESHARNADVHVYKLRQANFTRFVAETPFAQHEGRYFAGSGTTERSCCL